MADLANQLLKEAYERGYRWVGKIGRIAQRTMVYKRKPTKSENSNVMWISEGDAAVLTEPEFSYIFRGINPDDEEPLSIKELLDRR